jgi:hypothetical protein
VSAYVLKSKVDAVGGDIELLCFFESVEGLSLWISVSVVEFFQAILTTKTRRLHRDTERE